VFEFSCVAEREEEGGGRRKEERMMRMNSSIHCVYVR